ncbi:MAG TPA: hypothetical protein VOA87_22715 [Thermoanaerobaculia bacterium]|nr:hypothetical protein [Thermoanaerobaculia bacterium]
MKRFLPAAPLFILLVWVALPLARGAETLFLRDVLNTHLEMKWSQAEAMRQGFFPLIDPYRAGGQPLAGNPNAVPFYPDNLLYLLSSPFWALNAHFWIHLLLAPFAFYWLARTWGLAREPAWAAAVCYTLSGFFLSHLSFYNLIAGATLAPAFIAATLTLPNRRWAAPLLAILWTLLLLGGDPLLALLALLLSLAALLTTGGRMGPAPPPSTTAKPRAFEAPQRDELAPSARPTPRLFFLFFFALLAGTLLATPQLVEFARILPASFRGHWGYTAAVATVASWDPRQAAEWLLPFLFGRPDLIGPGGFWGSRFFTDVPPYYLSLYPGLLTLALVAASGRPRSRAAYWAWGAVAAGIFFALGRFNPLAAWLFALPGGGALRYPVKLWLPVAIGASLLCGLGFERLADEAGRRCLRRALAVLAVVLAALWIYLTFLPGLSLPRLRGLIPAGFPDSFVANERLRWAGLCLVSLLLLAALAAAMRLLRFRPAAGGALLLAIHALAQILLLRPLYPTDAVIPYRIPPPALDLLPPGMTVVNGSFTHLFGPSNLDRGSFPAPRTLWLERRASYELYPSAGPMWKRRYELNASPEGLDSFLTRMSQGAVGGSSDADRVRLLAAWGVGRLLLDRPLAAGTRGAQLLRQLPSFGGELDVYAIVDPAPEVYLARQVFEAPHLNAAYRLLIDPRFDPAKDAVIPSVPGELSVRAPGSGIARLRRRGPESLEAEVDVASAGLLVIQRAHLPLYRATVDGRPAPIVIANLQRMAVAVPAGRHRVRVWIDRRPLAASMLGVAAGLVGLAGLVWRRRVR